MRKKDMSWIWREYMRNWKTKLAFSIMVVIIFFAATAAGVKFFLDSASAPVKAPGTKPGASTERLSGPVEGHTPSPSPVRHHHATPTPTHVYVAPTPTRTHTFHPKPTHTPTPPASPTPTVTSTVTVTPTPTDPPSGTPSDTPSVPAVSGSPAGL